MGFTTMKKYLFLVLCIVTIISLSFFGRKYVALIHTARVAEADFKLTQEYGSKSESEAALRQNPKDVKALRGMVYAFQLEHNREKAWEWMQKDFAAEPDNPYTQLIYAVMLDEYKNRPNDALTILDKLSQRKNTDAASAAKHSADKIRRRRNSGEPSKPAVKTK